MEGKNYQDENNPTDLEKRHIPQISIGQETQKGEKEVKINIGEADHPMEDDHNIEWLELKKNGKKIGRVEFSDQDRKAKAIFSTELKDGDKLVANNYCNLHGLWYEEIKV